MSTKNDDSASGTVEINIHFLRSYPALQSKSDDQLGQIVAKLHNELIETDADLNQVSRDSLSSKLPALALDALKPVQQQKRGRDDDDDDEQVEALRLNVAFLRTERDAFRLAALRARSTTERVLSASDDSLSNIFENAPTESFWLPPITQQGSWDAPWSQYAVTDSSRAEDAIIQPKFTAEFLPKFPCASQYEIVDTHKGWNKLTQDATLFLRGRAKVELTIAAIIELVGQDETGFPSKKHKAKFLRDCMRIYRRCGSSREVHGVITDLSRIVAVKMTGLDDQCLPEVVKTAVLEGTEVHKLLTQFAFAVPHLLGVEGKRIIFPGDTGGTASRPIVGSPLHVDCGKVLGHGLHGTVYTVVGPGRENSYIKYFRNKQECQKEARILQLLLDGSIPNVPTLLKVSQDGHSILASPVGKDSYYWQGHGIVWKIGLSLLVTLEHLHAKQLCHRDVRPDNIIVLENEMPLLIDWVSMATIGEEADDYVGTTHYASVEVLDSLIDGVAPTPSAKHDLESLVYSIYSLSREPTNYPQAIEIEKNPSRPLADFYAAVRTAWLQEAQTNEMLRILVEAAQNCEYSTLKTEFGRKY